MIRKWLAVCISITAVILFILTSFTNVVGYQTVQISNQKILNEEVDQKELLFQTIVDIANNKEIQGIILKSQMSSGKFFNPDVKLLKPITEQQLKQMYFIGLLLSKIISKSRIQSMVQKYQLQNPIIQEEINGVIEKDVTLNSEITQLSDAECDCESEKISNSWKFPILCSILLITAIFSAFFSAVFFIITLPSHIILFQDIGEFFGMIAYIIIIIAYGVNCFWSPYSGG